MKIAIVLGTRPEILKNGPIVHACRALSIDCTTLYTNQHTDAAMHEPFFEACGYQPDLRLPETFALGRAVDWVQSILRETRIDCVLVNGDTAAALVGAIAALYSDTPLAHVEAGLRAQDPHMIEERNRIMVDACARWLFAYTSREADYLRAANEVRGTVYEVGNTTVDFLAECESQLRLPDSRPYLFATLHRKELTESRERMISALSSLSRLASHFDCVYLAIHPRTRDAMLRHSIPSSIWRGVQVLEPLRPLAALSFQKHAAVVVTDSGCVQEEAYLLNTPCVTVRENTERQATVELGANCLAGYDTEVIVTAVLRQAERYRDGARFPPLYGPAGAGRRIVDILREDLADARSMRVPGATFAHTAPAARSSPLDRSEPVNDSSIGRHRMELR